MDRITDILPTRVSLLQQAQSSRESAVWDELLLYYKPFITKILVRTGLRGSDLEDVRQQIFLKLWNGLKTYKRDEKRARFRNWLSTLIRNAAIDWYNANRHDRQKLPIDELGVNDLDPHLPEVECVIEKEWQRHIVETAMEQLKSVFSGKAFEVFAYSLQGVSSDEIARRLGIRKESVYVLKTRVKQRLHVEIRRLRLELEGECGDE